MISLVDLKQILVRNQSMTWLELKKQFAEDEDMLQAMLDYFCNRGQLQLTTVMPSCGDKCGSCDKSQFLVYKWI